MITEKGWDIQKEKNKGMVKVEISTIDFYLVNASNKILWLKQNFSHNHVLLNKCRGNTLKNIFKK